MCTIFTIVYYALRHFSQHILVFLVTTNHTLFVPTADLTRSYLMIIRLRLRHYKLHQFTYAAPKNHVPRTVETALPRLVIALSRYSYIHDTNARDWRSFCGRISNREYCIRFGYGHINKITHIRKSLDTRKGK